MKADDLARRIRANECIEPMSWVEIIGDLDLDAADYKHKLIIHDSIFKGYVNLREARLDRSVDFARCVFEQAVNFAGAAIRGSLVLRNTRFFAARQPPGLEGIDKITPFLADFERMRVEGTLDIAGVQSAVTFDLADARIDGQFYCSSLPESRTTFHRHLHCPNIVVGGQMNLCGVWIGEDLQLQGAELKKDFFCRPFNGNASEICGDAFLAGISVQGELHITGTRVIGELSMQNSKVKEDVYLEPYVDGAVEHCVTIGRVYMADAEIAGIVSFRGAHVAGECDLRGLKGDLRCGAWPGEPDSLGAARRVPAEFDGPFDASGCQCRRAVIDGRMCRMGLNLSLAKVDRLEIENELCEKPNLDGLVFKELSLPDNRSEAELLAKIEPFERTTYAVFEKWLRDHGRDDDADDLYIAMRRRNRTFGMTRMARLRDWFLDVSMRYGIQSYRLAIVLVMLLAGSFVLFMLPNAVELKPSLRPQAAAIGGPSVGQRFWLAVRTAVPVVTVFSSDDWRPSSQPLQVTWEGTRYYLIDGPDGWCIRYDQAASAVSLASWVIVPLFVAGVSGFARRR